MSHIEAFLTNVDWQTWAPILVPLIVMAIHLMQEHDTKFLPAALWWLKALSAPLAAFATALHGSPDPNAKNVGDALQAVADLDAKLSGQIEQILKQLPKQPEAAKT